MNSDPLAASGKPAGAEDAKASTAKKAPKKTTAAKKDQPYFDPVAYGNGPDDAVQASEADENAAITHHGVTIGGAKIAYTATVGHLVTVDPSSSKPNAKMFYVAFTKDGAKEGAKADGHVHSAACGCGPKTTSETASAGAAAGAKPAAPAAPVKTTADT